MEDKSALLGSLKIDRGPLGDDGGSPWKWIGLALLLVSLSVGAWFLLRPAPAVPIHVGSARIVDPQSAEGGSVLDATGYVVARRRATVSSKVTGKIVDVLIEEGSHVNEGDVVARIDDSNARTQLELARSQLEAARSNLAEVKVQLADADRQAVRAKELAAKQLVSQSSLDTTQANADALRARLASTQRNVEVSERTVAVQQQLLDDTVVRAPFTGVITEKNAQPGEMISPLSAGGAGTRTGIGTLVDMKSLEVEVDVNENFINRVTPEQPADAVLNAYPDWKIPAEVIAVIPTADRSKATVKVRIKLKAEDPRIIPDMGARVSFLAAPKSEQNGAPPRPVVLVPSEAVRKDTAGAAVFQVHGGTVERRAVTLGNTRGTDVEVTAGLSGGESLVVGDLSKLADGTKVKIAKE